MINIKRQNVTERCRRICAGYNENSICLFAENSVLLGFIDTSQEQNGSRGIAFSDKGVYLNFYGDTTEILYKDIRSVQIISSFEDFFSDELSIVYSDSPSDPNIDPYSNTEIRISDLSLDKSELKRLIDGFCVEYQEEDQLFDQEKTDDFFPRESITDTNEEPAPQSSGQSSEELSQNSDDLPQSSEHPDHQSLDAVSESQTNNDNNTPASSADENILNNESGMINTNQTKESVSDNYDIFDNDIPAIFRHQDDFVDIVFEDRAPVITETVLPQPGTITRVIESRDPTPTPQNTIYNNRPSRQLQTDSSDDLYEDEAAERTRIQNMSHEETLSFLSQSLSEINAPLPEPQAASLHPEPSIYTRQSEPTSNARPFEVKRQNSTPPAKTQIQSQAQNRIQTQNQNQSQIRSVSSNQTNQTPMRMPAERSVVRDERKPVLPTTPLTEEPIWGDIYIKASRNLRELCESGRLSMGQIETELDSRLLDSAKAFAEIIADESKVPKVLIPKITELKAASKNFDQYFQMGEDIAVRAMFFMMYQMLSYADRIVETPETKERLNDFFRRFGSAGITLSMLDMRV